MSGIRELKVEELDQVAGGDGTLNLGGLVIHIKPTPLPWVINSGSLTIPTDQQVGG